MNVQTMSIGQVTVRIHGNAMNFLYCRPDSWNTHIHTHTHPAKQLQLESANTILHEKNP